MRPIQRVSALACSSVVLALSACSIQFHNEAEAERARKALETYEKVNLSALIQTGTDNVARLTEAELETRREWHRTEQASELTLLIGGTAWSDLEKTVKKQAVASAHKMHQSRIERRDQENSLKSQVEDFLGIEFHPESKLPTKLEDIPEDGSALESLFDAQGVVGDEKTDYQTVFQQAGRVRMAQAVLSANEAAVLPKELRELIAKAQQEIREHKTLAAELNKNFKAAKQAVGDAEKQIALAKENADKGVLEALSETLGAKLKEESALLAKAIDNADNIPVLAERLKITGLMDITSRYEALKAKATESPAYGVAKELLEVLRTDPDISKRLGLGSVPPLNALVLELALHQMRYEQAKITQAFRESKLRLLEQKAQAYQRAAANWVLASQAIDETPSNILTILADTPMHKFFETLPTGVTQEEATNAREQVLRAMIAAGTAKRLGSDRLAELDIADRQLLRQHTLDQSRVSLTAWNAVIQAPLREIVTYHEGGITSDEIATLINALGLSAIAVGVN